MPIVANVDMGTTIGEIVLLIIERLRPNFTADPRAVFELRSAPRDRVRQEQAAGPADAVSMAGRKG